MISLTDKIWQDLEGGYRTPYDASVPLRNLEKVTEPEAIKKILAELWDELHHQGDVGLASYLAVPHLVRIGKQKGLFGWQLIGLCNTIEIERHSENNEALPPEFERYYTQGLNELEKFVLENINKDLDDSTYIAALSTLAACRGRIQLAEAIIKLEDKSTMDEFLEEF